MAAFGPVPARSSQFRGSDKRLWRQRCLRVRALRVSTVAGVSGCTPATVRGETHPDVCLDPLHPRRRSSPEVYGERHLFGPGEQRPKVVKPKMTEGTVIERSAEQAEQAATGIPG